MKLYRQRRYVKRNNPNNLLVDTKLINLNISGTKFSAIKSMLQNHENIMQVILTEGIYLRNTNEYFLNRDPNVFQSILNFCRFGQYHFPTNICGPLIEKELSSWKIDLNDIDIERCCMGNLMETKTKLKTLRKFEEAIKDKDDVTGITDSIFIGKYALNKCCKYRKLIHDILDDTKGNSYGLIYQIFIGLAMLLAIIIFVVSSHESFRKTMSEDEYHEYYKLSSNRHVDEAPTNITNSTASRKIFTRPMDILETGNYVCMTIFTIDLALRLIFCETFLKFFLNIYTLIDLLSIFPFFFIKLYSQFYDYAGFSTQSEHSTIDYVTFMKVFIVFKVLRLLRSNRGFKVLYYTMIISAKEMAVLFLFIGISSLCFASIMFFFESHEDFKSIPHGLWWSIITMSTIGYGDIVPKTFPGYIVGALCALSGVMLISLCVPIVVNHFMLFYNHSLTIFPKKKVQAKNKNNKYSNHLRSPSSLITLEGAWAFNDRFHEETYTL